MFVFRNNTVERFFPKGYEFSGYDDISVIPEADGYVWFYQVPFGYDNQLIASQIDSYSEKLDYVLTQIPKSKNVLAMSMVNLYSVNTTEDDYRIDRAIDGYNESLRQKSEIYHNLKVVDIQEFTDNYSKQELMDWRFWFISQMGLNPKLSKPFMSWFEKKLSQVALKRKKCVVLDLDNTLWGGVLGEDGIDGIKLSGDYPGKAFHYFQEALLSLSESGVILAVCSKNNEGDVLEAWDKNPYMVLKKDNFAAYRINWNDKASNIKELAEELNIGLDSFVFVDDNPTERELIRQMLPMVSVPEFPAQPYELPIFYKNLVEEYFKVYKITDEDKKKTEQYKANASRARAQKSFTDLDSFIESLDIQMVIEKANEFNLPRIAQMTQKTNQFNLTTRRYTDADIQQMIDEGAGIWSLAVSDKFGDSGVTGCIIVKNDEIDTFLLSCRILGKKIEDVFLKTILSLLKVSGSRIVKAKFIPTAKNAQVKDFYDRNGFILDDQSEEGDKSYHIDLLDADLDVKPFYTIKVL